MERYLLKFFKLFCNTQYIINLYSGYTKFNLLLSIQEVELITEIMFILHYIQ